MQKRTHAGTQCPELDSDSNIQFTGQITQEAPDVCHLRGSGRWLIWKMLIWVFTCTHTHQHMHAHTAHTQTWPVNINSQQKHTATGNLITLISLWLSPTGAQKHRLTHYCHIGSFPLWVCVFVCVSMRACTLCAIGTQSCNY